MQALNSSARRTCLTDKDLIENHPPLDPQARLVWTAIVDVEDRRDLGRAPHGQRFIVPISGGRFYGGPDFPDLSGEVLPGGADRQVLRDDGVKELSALYEMRTESGAEITVLNQVIVDESRKPDRYAMSVIRATAPDGEFAWLNRRMIVGTLQSARPARQAVIIRAWLMDLAD